MLKILNETVPFVQENVLQKDFEALSEQSEENLKLNLIYLDALELEMESQSLKKEILIQQSYFQKLNNQKKQAFIQSISIDCMNRYEQEINKVKKIRKNKNLFI